MRSVKLYLVVENEQTHTTIIDFSSKPQIWYFKSNPRSKNRIPGPNSRKDFQNVIQILNFQVLSPEPPETRSKSSMNRCIVQGAQPIQDAHRKVLVLSSQCPMGWTIKLRVFVVNSIRPLVFASFIAPGKIQENVQQTYSYMTYYFYTVQVHDLRAICPIYRKHSSSKRWLTHVEKPPTNQWLKAASITHVLISASPVETTVVSAC